MNSKCKNQLIGVNAVNYEKLLSFSLPNDVFGPSSCAEVAETCISAHTYFSVQELRRTRKRQKNHRERVSWRRVLLCIIYLWPDE
jgi:hypothetical protein